MLKKQLGGVAMNKAQFAFSIVSVIQLSGCAGAITAWKSDPIQAYTARDNTVYTMTGDRRTAVYNNGKFCAESMPDAVAVYAASSKGSLSTKPGTEIGVADTTSAGVLQTFQRTEIAEVLRQLGWNTCLAWSQGAITNTEYLGLLDKMVVGSVAVMAERAKQPLGATTPATLLLTPAQIAEIKAMKAAPAADAAPAAAAK